MHETYIDYLKIIPHVLVPESLVSLQPHQAFVPLLCVESIIVGSALPAVVDHQPPWPHASLMETREPVQDSFKDSTYEGNNGVILFFQFLSFSFVRVVLLLL